MGLYRLCILGCAHCCRRDDGQRSPVKQLPLLLKHGAGPLCSCRSSPHRRHLCDSTEHFSWMSPGANKFGSLPSLPLDAGRLHAGRPADEAFTNSFPEADITVSASQPASLMVTCVHRPKIHCVVVSCTLVMRCRGSRHRALAMIKAKRTVQFPDWSTGFKHGFSSALVPGSDAGQMFQAVRMTHTVFNFTCGSHFNTHFDR